MLARTPRTSIAIAVDTKPRRLNRDRAKAVRDKIVVIMRAVEPTPFAAEGPCRAGIRESLCLQGWRWGAADVAAAEVVAAALSLVGARRPTWQQGQPEYTQPGALPILRECCVNCSKPLPEGHYKFCCRECSRAYGVRHDLRRLDEEYYLKKKARRAALRQARTSSLCERCGDAFQPGAKTQRFCSVYCVKKTYICD